MRIFCLTSDKYINSVKPFCYLMDKYWPSHPEVVVCGFSAPTWHLPKRYRWHSIGKFEDYPFNKWSNAVIKLFSQDFGDDRFILMLEDYWITKPVYDKQVLILREYMRTHNDVIKIDLGTDRRYADRVVDYITYQRIPLLLSDPESAYHMSLMAGIWNRKALLDVLRPNESPHDVELKGTNRLSQMKYQVIGTRSWIPGDSNAMPLHHTLGQRGGDHSVYYFDELNHEDRVMVESML